MNYHYLSITIGDISFFSPVGSCSGSLDILYFPNRSLSAWALFDSRLVIALSSILDTSSLIGPIVVTCPTTIGLVALSALYG